MNFSFAKNILSYFENIFSRDNTTVPTLLCLDINGNLLIESSSKMLDSSDTSISFTVHSKQIYIYGSGLSVTAFSKAGMNIKGKIERVEIFEV